MTSVSAAARSPSAVSRVVLRWPRALGDGHGEVALDRWGDGGHHVFGRQLFFERCLKLCQQPLAFQGRPPVAARHAGHGRKIPAQYRAIASFIVASAAFVAIFVAVTLSAFHRPTPHDVPVGIVASASVTQQVEHALDGAAPGGFSFRGYPSAASATAAIAQREIDGALVANGPDLHLLVTQAGGTAPEQALNGAFTAVAAHSGRPLIVTDVVPPRASDSQALSSWFTLLSVLIPSLAAGSASAPPRQARRTRSSAARNRPRRRSLTRPGTSPPPTRLVLRSSSPAALIMSRTALSARSLSTCCTSRPTRCSRSPDHDQALEMVLPGIGSARFARQAGELKGSAKYCVSCTTCSSANSMMLTE
jgi:hypothetical protein